jgi:hypothetical protein
MEGFEEPQSVNLESSYSDEIGKIPLSRRGCSPFINGAHLGGSSLPQNLGSGQRIEPTPRSGGSVGGHRSVGKMIVTVSYRFAGTLHCNDKASVLVVLIISSWFLSPLEEIFIQP